MGKNKNKKKKPQASAPSKPTVKETLPSVEHNGSPSNSVVKSEDSLMPAAKPDKAMKVSSEKNGTTMLDLGPSRNGPAIPPPANGAANGFEEKKAVSDIAPPAVGVPPEPVVGGNGYDPVRHPAEAPVENMNATLGSPNKKEQGTLLKTDDSMAQKKHGKENAEKAVVGCPTNSGHESILKEAKSPGRGKKRVHEEGKKPKSPVRFRLARGEEKIAGDDAPDLPDAAALFDHTRTSSIIAMAAVIMYLLCGGFLLAMARLSMVVPVVLTYFLAPAPYNRRIASLMTLFGFGWWVKNRGKVDLSARVYACGGGPSLPCLLHRDIHPKDALRAVLREWFPSLFMHLQPNWPAEGTRTAILCRAEKPGGTGRAGLLQFSSDMFKPDGPVQPVAVRVWHPFPVALSHVGSFWVLDLLVGLALPFATVDIHYLPALHREKDESLREFSARAQHAIAADLGVPATHYSMESL